MVYISPGQASSLTPESLNPVAFVACSAFVFILAVVAGDVPARGALQADPLLRLRENRRYCSRITFLILYHFALFGR
jgi:hypothetical protein